jgi:hypothetical protein
MSHKDNADLLRRVASDLVETDAPKQADVGLRFAAQYLRGLAKQEAAAHKKAELARKQASDAYDAKCEAFGFGR